MKEHREASSSRRKNGGRKARSATAARSAQQYSLNVMFCLSILLMLASLYVYNPGAWLIEDDEVTGLYEMWRLGEGGVPERDVLTAEGLISEIEVHDVTMVLLQARVGIPAASSGQPS